MSSMPEHQKYPGVTIIGGKIFVVSGCDSASRHSSVECYDPSRDQWIKLSLMLFSRSGWD